jgi:hypothetical protein
MERSMLGWGVLWVLPTVMACHGSTRVSPAGTSREATRDVTGDVRLSVPLVERDGECREWVGASGFWENGLCATVIESSKTSDYGGVATDSTSVYWAKDTAIRKAPLRGGPIVTVANSPLRANKLLIEGTNLYWISNDWKGPCRSRGCASVWSVPSTGGSPATVVRAKSSIEDFYVEPPVLYFATDDALMSAPLRGGPPVLLAVMGKNHSNLAVGKDGFYWAKGSDIVSVPFGGGTPRTVATQQDHPDCVAVDGDAVLWRNSGHSIREGTGTLETLMSRAAVGGTTTKLAAFPWADWSLPCDVAVDSENVYWTNTRGTLLRIARAGGKPVVIAVQEPPAVTESRGLAVSSTGGVYWAVSTKHVDQEGTPEDSAVWCALAPR